MNPTIRWLYQLHQILAWVATFHRLGVPTVPTCRPTSGSMCSASWHEGHPQSPKSIGKKPLVVGYPSFADQLPDVDRLRRLVTEHFPCNLAIVVPRGMCVVEADSPEAEAELMAMGGEQLLRTPARERREGRGRGFLFKLRHGLDLRNTAHLGRHGAIDVKAAGGIFVIPESIHASGHQYIWVPGQSPLEVPIAELRGPLESFLAPLQRARVGSAGRSQRARFDARDGATDVPRQRVEMPPEISSRVRFLIASTKTIRDLYDGRGKRFGDQSASGIDFSFARALAKNGVSASEIAAAIAHRPGAHRIDAAYCLRTAQAAHDWKGGRR
jgi:Bifunctional DNA primase/polymerase, N-terminal